MPLPRDGSVSVAGGSVEPKPAFLVKIPEHVWQELCNTAKAGERVKVSLDGEPTLILPHAESIPLQAHTTGNATEIHTVDKTGTALTHVAQANARLTVPISASTSAKAAERARAATEARDKEKKANAERINGVAPPRPVAAVVATSMGRTQSSPVSGISGSISAPNTAPTTPVVPLKTRVVQLLALGPCPQPDMIRRLGGAEADIMRVVNVVGRKVAGPGSTPSYELQPNQYSKIKIGEWPYSSSERKNVIARARKAFDELKLPPDADERVELNRKESSAVRSDSNSSSESSSGSMKHALPPKPAAAAPTPVPAHASSSKSAKPPVMNHPLPAKPVSSFTPSAPPSKPRPVANGNGNSNGNGNGNGVGNWDGIAVKDLPKIPKKDPVPKKDHGSQKTVFSKQLDKFRAEKRAASVPSARGERETASPRPVASGSKSKTSVRGERSTSSERKRKSAGKRRQSRDYTSSERSSDDDEPPRNAKGKKRPSSDDDASSGDDGDHRGRSSKRGTPAKKRHLAADGPPQSPDAMRERYEELFPAYELLAKKLTTIYQDCENVELEGHLNTTPEEVAKLAARFQKWHTELEGIRQWFADTDA